MNAIKCYDLAIFKNLDIYNVHVDFAKKYEDMGRFEKHIKNILLLSFNYFGCTFYVLWICGCNFLSVYINIYCFFNVEK